ncbi:NADAR family protein [Accumulibacter sp.]|uniref:NADAR family protein n=1 Tax=Accumulibacter sp. TaxID=2053492 RepID=UPI0026022B7E|nr:NADAR family protein [Accumulibacter sp.]
MREIRFYRPQDPFGFLSNYFEYRFFLEGRKWQSVEHYYQASKFSGTRLQEHIREIKRPGGARAWAHSHRPLWRADWEAIKCKAMRRALLAKFGGSAFLALELLSTGDAVLIEDSPVDTFWGCGRDGQGQSMLGRLQMEVREILRHDEEWMHD